ncbi:SMC-Scp complex subunit ScpB [Corallococcus sp. AB049A]|uniref:SMC-Scp complex subunit ScpB n=1 Tax=Corallococcus interemptor TaxID=2316720 RepID=A0A3A8R6M5_9BACT|nr:MULTISPECIES: SMC-Scp complex subunit ScpB [Corallococcus]RKH51848.1 SMC-Scp complex subunit ScpB [Corallococcus sp. AB050B]RKH71064.1 SMC-Scp complex subunit ScpB [Corallococcus interemptor]RKI63885.1 SMC-Scp complex subunit ScpB [Corallococcus sp. AB049A]
MTTGNGPDDADETPAPGTPGGPGQFSEEEIASVTGPGPDDAELDGVEAAAIEEGSDDDENVPDLQSSFEKLLAKSRNLSPDRIRTVLESVLFVAERPLSVDELYQATGIPREPILQALDQLSGIHREGISGIVLYEVAGGWQFRTDPHSAEYVRRYLRVKPQRLTRAAVETLAIIAYRQPVTRPELEDIRGVDCGAVLKALMDRKLVKILGKREEVGRPILYGTTREFLEFFALKDLSALPTLREFHELTQEHREIVEKEAAPPPPKAEGTVAALSDPNFTKRMEKNEAASEAALEELEEAMAAAERSQKVSASILESPPSPEKGDSEGPKPE